MHPWHDIEPGVAATPNAIVEIPRLTRNKYELDKETGLMRLDRVLFSSFVYPFNYGFIPRTYARDHDPMDCFIMGEDLLPMTLVPIRPLGMVCMTDEGKVDDKILAVPVADPRFAHQRKLEDISPNIIREIEHFLSHYKDLEEKKTVIIEWVSRDDAVTAIEESLQRYRTDFGPRPGLGL